MCEVHNLPTRFKILANAAQYETNSRKQTPLINPTARTCQSHQLIKQPIKITSKPTRKDDQLASI